jgi:hypothetical protein
VCERDFFFNEKIIQQVPFSSEVFKNSFVFFIMVANGNVARRVSNEASSYSSPTKK